MNIAELKLKFKDIFKRDAGAVFFAPGRANLIGEHTDYNGGHVFPCALTFGTFLLASKRADEYINFYSLNFAEESIIKISIKRIKKTNKWADYPLGVVDSFLKDGAILTTGFDALYFGDVPTGAGLSSSASIEVVTATMINNFYNLGYTPIELAQISQKAENNFVGMNCGIMDQFASAMGKNDNAILLDCNTLKYEYCPVKMDGISLLIANTGQTHKLSSSQYNERREQCEEALSILKKHFKIEALCQLSVKDLPKVRELIKDDIIYRRASHAICENERTLEAVALLRKGDIEGFGKLVNMSHYSLEKDYEVTGPELDAMAYALQKQEGVLGARMMGGGFGGCCIALVKNEFLSKVKEEVAKEYCAKISLKPEFYVASIGSGARKL